MLKETKHKDERSLSHYISQTTSEQKRQCSRPLREAFYGHPPTQTSQDSRSSTHSEGENTGRTGEVTSVSQTLQNHFLSLAQPYPNCTQHIQIGTMNAYHGAGPSQPTDHSDCKPAKRRRIIIERIPSDYLGIIESFALGPQMTLRGRK